VSRRVDRNLRTALVLGLVAASMFTLSVLGYLS
jgi:hypothetical protein